MLKYGDTTTYKHTLSAEQLEEAAGYSNRGRNQTIFLFQLVDGDFDKLMKLERQIKKKFVSYCPGTVQEMVNILLDPPSEMFPTAGKSYKESNFYS